MGFHKLYLPVDNLGKHCENCGKKVINPWSVIIYKGE